MRACKKSSDAAIIRASKSDEPVYGLRALEEQIEVVGCCAVCQSFDASTVGLVDSRNKPLNLDWLHGSSSRPLMFNV